MDGSFGNSNGFRDRDSGRDGFRERGGGDNGRNKLMNEIMSEMQSGMNMPNSGSNPVMNMQFGGSNPMMGNPGMGNSMGNPMMGMGMGNGNPMMGNPMMGNGNPMMGNGNPMMGNGNPMMGGMGNAPAGLSPQITGPMGNPIMGEFQGPYDHMPVSMDGQGVGNQAIAGRNDVDEEEYEDDDPEGAEGDEGGLGGLRGQGQSTDNEKDEDDSDDNSGILDNLLESGKEPLIGAIILIMLLTPQFNAVFNQFAPRIVTENLIYSLAAKGLIFFIIFYLIQRFL